MTSIASIEVISSGLGGTLRYVTHVCRYMLQLWLGGNGSVAGLCFGSGLPKLPRPLRCGSGDAMSAVP